MFAEDGEAAFRAGEERITLELLGSSEHQVLSLGGGAIGSRAVREALAEHLVIWVDVDAATAWVACRAPAGRSRATAREFERLHREREPLYA